MNIFESIYLQSLNLKESTDYMIVGQGKNNVHATWNNPDAYPFFFLPNSPYIIFNKTPSTMHLDIDIPFKDALHASTNKFEFKKLLNDNNIILYNFNDISPEYFTYLKSIIVFVDGRPQYKDISNVGRIGRIWKDKKLISVIGSR